MSDIKPDRQCCTKVPTIITKEINLDLFIIVKLEPVQFRTLKLLWKVFFKG